MLGIWANSEILSWQMKMAIHSDKRYKNFKENSIGKCQDNVVVV